MPPLESLVVVDADPRSRDATAFGFEREGCVVHATSGLHAARASAVRTLERGQRGGELRFDDGQLAQARVGKQTGANAFHQMLLWEKADLHLRFVPPGGERRIHKPVDRLLEDGA